MLKIKRIFLVLILLLSLSFVYACSEKEPSIKEEYYLKADIELVSNIHLSKSKQSMLKLLVEYCDEMGLKLIAEGIETQEELECICNLHVHYGQGYYLGIPDCKFNGVSSQALQYLMNIHGMIKT